MVIVLVSFSGLGVVYFMLMMFGMVYRLVIVWILMVLLCRYSISGKLLFVLVMCLIYLIILCGVMKGLGG